jgi:hypothetical protein
MRRDGFEPPSSQWHSCSAGKNRLQDQNRKAFAGSDDLCPGRARLMRFSLELWRFESGNYSADGYLLDSGTHYILWFQKGGCAGDLIKDL